MTRTGRRRIVRAPGRRAAWRTRSGVRQATPSASRRARCAGFRSPASRRHTSSRVVAGHITESMPSSLTPRRMNGITVVCSSVPPVSPEFAIAAAVHHRPRQPRQRVAAHRIHGAGPQRLLERLACPSASGRARGRRSRRATAGSRARCSLPRERRHRVAERRQTLHGDAADAAGRAGDDDRTARRRRGRCAPSRRSTAPP